MVTGELAGASHRYHTECPPALPAWLGSPLSFVAPELVPVTVPLLPLIDWALAKASFAGCARTDSGNRRITVMTGYSHKAKLMHFGFIRFAQGSAFTVLDRVCASSPLGATKGCPRRLHSR